MTRLLRILALAASAALASSCAGSPPPPPAGAVAPQSAAAGTESDVRSRRSPDSAWRVKGDVPNTGLPAAPACRERSECDEYTTECSVKPECLSGTCYMKNLVRPCSLAGGGKGVCDRGTCVAEAALAQVCFESVALERYPFSGEPVVYGRNCPTQQCLEDQARVARTLNAQVGRQLAACFLVGSGSGMPAVDWNLDAPYARSFPGLKKQDLPASTPNQEAP